MPREFSRTSRVSEQLQREVADLLLRDVNDPRLHGVTVTSAEVSRDLAHATVYVTALGASANPDDVIAALKRATGFLRSGLAKRLRMRVLPDLRFVYDQSMERGDRIASLIESVSIHKTRHDGGDD